MFEPVRPEYVRNFVNYLKHNNHLYNSIDINLSNISHSMSQFANSETEMSLGDFLANHVKPLEIYIEQQFYKQGLKKGGDDSLLHQNRSSANKTVLVSESPSAVDTEEELTIAPSENKKLFLFLSDQYYLLQASVDTKSKEIYHLLSLNISMRYF